MSVYGGTGWDRYNFAEFLENFISNFGYNPFVGTGIGPSEGDIPNVEQPNPDDVWENMDPGIKQFMIILSKYLEGLDSDDMDRIARQEEANRWLDMYNKYKNNEISLEELKAFEPVELAGMPGWDDYFQGIVGGTEGPEGESELTEAEIAEQAAAISDEDALKAIWENLPDPLKKIITAVKRDPIKVVKDIADLIIDDPLTTIKKAQVIGADISAILKGGNWRDIKVFGPFIIPGLPLPPGIIEATIGDIIQSAEGMGKKIEDFIGGVLDGSIWDEVKDWIKGVFDNDDSDDSIFGGTLGGFEDYIKGVLGGVVGGSILVDIYDEVKGWFEDTGVPPIPGGEPPVEEPDEEPTPKQGDDISDFESDFEEEEIEFDGFDSVDDDTTDDTSFGIELGDPETYDPDITVPDETGGPIEIGGSDDDDDDDQTGGPQFGPFEMDDGTYDPDVYIPGIDDDDDDDPEEPGSFPDIGPQDEEEDPDQPGSTTDSSSSSGGGGGGGGGGGVGDAGPFMRGIEYVVPAVPGLLTTPNIDYAKGLIQTPDSKGNLDLLIQRLQDRMLT